MEEQEDKVNIVCPHCNTSIDAPVINITDSDKKEYFRCILGSNSYSKIHCYLDDSISITLKELTTSELSALVKDINACVDENDVVTRAFRAKFMLSCTSFIVDERELLTGVSDKKDKNMDDYVADYVQIFGNLSSLLVTMADRALGDFTLFIDTLAKDAILTKDF